MHAPRQGPLQIQGPSAGGENAIDRDISIIVEEEKRVAVRDTCMGARIAWVKFDRLSKHAFGQNVVGP